MNDHSPMLQKFERIMGLTSHSLKYRRNEMILGLAFLGLYLLGQVVMVAMGDGHLTPLQATAAGWAILACVIGFLGVPLLFAGVPGWVFLNTTSSKFDVIRSRPFTTVALAVVILAHLVVIALAIPFFLMPEGAEIRPMGWPFFLLVVSFLAFLLVMPISVYAIIKERPRFPGIFCLMGWITPFFFGMGLLQFAVWLKGLNLAD